MTTEQINGTDNLELQLPDVAGKLTNWKDRASKAKIAASGIKQVTNDEEDKKASDMIVKLRNTLDGWKKDDGSSIEGIKQARLEITGRLDAARKILMQPEKMIEEEVERLKGLRNSHATNKLKEAKRVEEESNKQKNLENSKIEYRKKLRDFYANKQVDAINLMNANIKKHVDGLTLETWDTGIQRFDITPQLKRPVHEEWVTNMPKAFEGLTAEEALAIRLEPEFNFDEQNLAYQRIAAKIVENWKEDLAKIKEGLYNIKKLVDMGSNNGAETQKQAQWGAINDTAGKAERTLLDTAQEIREGNSEKSQTEQLGAEIQHQVSTQAIETPGGRRKRSAKVVCEPKDLAKVWSSIIFQLYLKNGQNYHLQKDGSYSGWAQKLLDDFANDVPEDKQKIQGVVVEESVSTIARK